MSAQLKRKFALCGVLLAFVAAAVPTLASARGGDDNGVDITHGGGGNGGGVEDAGGHK